MGCTDPEGFGKWKPVFYPEKVGKGLTFFFFERPEGGCRGIFKGSGRFAAKIRTWKRFDRCLLKIISVNEPKTMH